MMILTVIIVMITVIITVLLKYGDMVKLMQLS